MLHQALLAHLREELNHTLLAAETAREGATHEEALAKSKYDTHGLELSYLAGSQFERARLLQSQVALLSRTSFRDFAQDEPIDLGALVEVRGAQAKTGHYLISLVGAGISVPLDGTLIQVISPDSLLGEELMNRRAGDRVEVVERPGLVWDIISVF